MLNMSYSTDWALWIRRFLKEYVAELGWMYQLRAWIFWEWAGLRLMHYYGMQDTASGTAACMIGASLGVPKTESEMDGFLLSKFYSKTLWFRRGDLYTY